MNLGLVVHNGRSGWEETNFPLFIHLDNHSQWTQQISMLFATPTPRSARFACSTDGRQSWIAFISQSGAEVSFNFDKNGQEMFVLSLGGGGVKLGEPA